MQEERSAVDKAKHFLESNLHSAEDPYTTALTAYALTLLHSPAAAVALRKMNSMTITQGTVQLGPAWQVLNLATPLQE